MSPFSSDFDRRGYGESGEDLLVHRMALLASPHSSSACRVGTRSEKALKQSNKLSYTVPQVVENAQNLRHMMREKSQGGLPPPIQYDGEDGYGLDLGPEASSARRPGFDGQARGGHGETVTMFLDEVQAGPLLADQPLHIEL